MVITTPKKGLNKKEITDQILAFETTPGGGQHENMDLLDDAILDTLADAKGDLFAGTAANAVGRVPAGANGTVLTADSAQATGMAWTSTTADALAALGVFTTFAPTLTQGVGVTITVNRARYSLIGKRATVIVGVTATSSGTAASPIALTAIPAALAPAVTSATGIYTIGGATLYTGAGNFRHMAVVPFGAAEFRFILDDAGTNWVGNTPSLQMVSGGHLSLALSYEVA